MSEHHPPGGTEYSPPDHVQHEETEKKLVRWRTVNPQKGPTPRPRHGHKALTIKDLIVVFGGGNEGMIDELHVFNTVKNEWVAPQIHGQPPPPCAAFGATSIGVKIYMFGGMVEYGKYTNDLYELNATRWEWRKLNPRVMGGTEFPCARLGHSFVASEKSQIAYLFGGLCNTLNDTRRNAPRYLNDLYTISLAASSSNLVWEMPEVHGEPPCPRESHTAVLYETDTVRRMVVYAGMNSSRLGDLFYLDLSNMTWTEIKFEDPRAGIPPVPRSLHSSVLIGEKMYVYGGWIPLTEQIDTENLNEKEWKCTSSLGCYDVAENRWIPLNLYSYEEEDIPRGRSGHCAAAVGGRMYIWSGRDGYRKAWSNQVCCRDMWLLDTVKPAQAGRVQLARAGFHSLDLNWKPVEGAQSYFLQIGFGDARDAMTPTKEAAKMRGPITPRKPPAPTPLQKEGEGDPKTGSVISTQGTTYTAPAPSKPTADEGGLPQDLFEDSEKNETNASSPKASGDSQPTDSESAEKIEGSATQESTVDEKPKKPEEPPKRPEPEDDILPWFDVGIIDQTSIIVTHYFNDRQQRLEKQLHDLVNQQANKCINDKCYTAEDKVPLINGQTYRFRVAALNGLGKGAWSETSSYKTCVPGFPSAPSSIRITKSLDGAQLTWEPPGNASVSGKIVEYSVYLAVKNQATNTTDNQLAFMRVYCGPQAECQVPQANLVTAYVDQSNKPAIIFRIAARNEKGYGPATQVRWLQDQQKMPVGRSFPPQPVPPNPGFHYQNSAPPQKRARFEP
ncbi:unnamed protein product [Caenorhabditis sp. 36 PRJEB53466]|nr:unnamed protein product [Caenorhabditis sp. 36 PRJEB53466]